MDIAPVGKCCIRKHIKRLRRQAGRCALQAASKSITDALTAMEQMCDALTVMGYLALPDEVDIDPFLSWALDCGKTVGVPVTLVKEGVLKIARLYSLAGGLASGPMGIREPGGCDVEYIEAESVDAVVVPGLAFDLHGGRLGYGGGFYDRLLPLLRPDALVVGVAFGFQVLEEVPMDAHDVRMDFLVTPDGVHKCVPLLGGSDGEGCRMSRAR